MIAPEFRLVRAAKGAGHTIRDVTCNFEDQAKANLFFAAGARQVSGFYSADSLQRVHPAEADSYSTCCLYTDHKVLVGNADGKVSVYQTVNKQTLQTNCICNARINSIEENRYESGKLCSYSLGSWDGTVYVINRDSLELIFRFSHSDLRFAVCSSFYNGIYIFGSQLGNLMLVQDVIVLRTFHQYHCDIIRKLVVLPQFALLVSCANDGFVKFLHLESFASVAEVHVSESFLYSMLVEQRDGAENQFSVLVGGESAVFSFGFEVSEGGRRVETNAVQTVLAGCSSVWSMQSLTARDGARTALCCTDSGDLLVFSSAAEAVDDAEELQLRALVQTKPSSQAAQLVRAELPKFAQAAETRGKREGQVQCFEDEEQDRVVACEWRGDRWELIGTVEEPPAAAPPNFYTGDDVFPAGTYDFVVDVALEHGSVILLPFNKDCDAAETARKFCAAHCLSTSYVQQIEQFITAQLGKRGGGVTAARSTDAQAALLSGTKPIASVRTKGFGAAVDQLATFCAAEHASQVPRLQALKAAVEAAAEPQLSVLSHNGPLLDFLLGAEVCFARGDEAQSAAFLEVLRIVLVSEQTARKLAQGKTASVLIHRLLRATQPKNTSQVLRCLLNISYHSELAILICDVPASYFNELIASNRNKDTSIIQAIKKNLGIAAADYKLDAWKRKVEAYTAALNIH